MKLVAQLPIGVGVFLILCSPTAWAWRAFKIIFISFPYEFNSGVMDAKIEIQNNTGDTALNVELNILEDIYDADFTFGIALEITEGNYTTLVNRSMNFCQFLKQRSLAPMLRIVYEDILKQSSFMKLCPIRKGTFSLQDYRLDEEMLPSYVPETKFYLDLKLSGPKGESLFNGRLNGKVDKSKGFNNLKMFSLG